MMWRRMNNQAIGSNATIVDMRDDARNVPLLVSIIS